MVGGVFISYRRADNPQAAGRLCDQLRREFGRRVVFFDVDTIPAGEPFPDYLAARIRSSRAVLVLIGGAWHDDPRLHDPADFVRQEVELAAAAGRRIIPVLIDGAELRPNDSRLPASLWFLAERNGRTLRGGADYRHDLAGLIADLRAAGVRRSWGRRLRQPAVAAALVVLAAVPLAVAVWQRAKPDSTPAAPPPTRPATPLFGNVSASDLDRLRSANKGNIVKMMGECGNKKLRDYAEQYEDDPETLWDIAQKILKQESGK
jgi:hypothetical protein